MNSLNYGYFRCYEDNYAHFLYFPFSKKIILFDAPEAEPILKFLYEKNYTIEALFITHKHDDHTAAIPQLIKDFSFPIYGPEKAKETCPFIDYFLHEEKILQRFDIDILPLFTPGHTLDSISYFLPNHNLLFAGDSLFSLGCGRLFEGDPTMMVHSLDKIRLLPDKTILCPGHDYFLQNLHFAHMLEPENKLFKRLIKNAAYLKNTTSLKKPSLLHFEKKYNPFLRLEDIKFKQELHKTYADKIEFFTYLREKRNLFSYSI